MTSVSTLSVPCPSCNKEVLMTKESKHRPFCSERCQLLDFGGWANEHFRVGAESIGEDQADYEVWPDRNDV